MREAITRQRGTMQESTTTLETLLKASEVARILGVRDKRVYELVGHIAVRYAPRTLRWRPADVQSWIEARRGKE
jgi:predicted DNA-binding transcriptional regulator AlpA